MDKFKNSGDVYEDQYSLWSLGNEYFEAAKVLYSTPATSVKCDMIVYYLLGHAAELFGKSFLCHKGISVDDLKDRYGHNLKKIIRQCGILGLHSEIGDYRAIKDLSQVYRQKKLEYRRNETQEFPGAEDLLNQVKMLGDVSFSKTCPFFNK